MRIKYIIGIIAIISTLWRCEDNFDPQIYGTFNTTLIPANMDDVQNLIATCYLPFASHWNNDLGYGTFNTWYGPSNGVYRTFDMTSDTNYPWLNHSNDEWYRFSSADYSNTVNYTRTYNNDHINHMCGISDVSTMTRILEVISLTEVIDDSKREKYLGEIRLCRGLDMYLTFHYYGPMPFIVDPDKLNDNDELYDLTRPTLAQCVQTITEDLEYAVEHIWTADETTEQGRYNKDYARICLMRHYLNEGYHMSGYYEKAIQLFKDLESEGRYSLFNKTTKVNPYADQFMSANGFNNEVIMAIDVVPTGNNASQGNYNALPIYCIPLHALVTEEANPDFGIIGSQWSQYYNLGKPFYDTFEEGDLRTACICTSYANRWDGGATQITGDHLNTAWWDGYIINKYRPEQSGTYQPMDLPLARWADALLLYAEALVRSTGSVSSDAVDAVNQVRTRAGLPGLPASITASKDTFLDALLLERGHEFFLEGFRKIDLIRFNKYATNCKIYKGVLPTHQYCPIPDYAVTQAEENGCSISQTYERPEYSSDLTYAKSL